MAARRAAGRDGGGVVTVLTAADRSQSPRRRPSSLLTFNPSRSFRLSGVSTYTIGEIAERSGFSASSLRYYEGIGLVEPASRTESGYRLYDDHTVNRLAFIARAKQLGCSLEEIADLAGIWDGERCGPVQRRFHELVTAKIRDAERQIPTSPPCWQTPSGGRTPGRRARRRALRRRLRLHHDRVPPPRRHPRPDRGRRHGPSLPAPSRRRSQPARDPRVRSRRLRGVLRRTRPRWGRCIGALGLVSTILIGAAGVDHRCRRKRRVRARASKADVIVLDRGRVGARRAHGAHR